MKEKTWKHISILLLIVSICFFTYSVFSPVSDSIKTIKEDKRIPEYKSEPVFPRKKKVYNEYVGSYAITYHFSLANGWREDDISGGFNKEIFYNPYINFDLNGFRKHTIGGDYQHFMYKRGKKYSGKIKEELSLMSGGEKTIFRASCIKGQLQGKGTLTNAKTGQLIAQCTFEDGELVGECISWDLKSNIETRIIYVKDSRVHPNVLNLEMMKK